MLFLIVGHTWKIRRTLPEFFEEDVGVERYLVMAPGSNSASNTMAKLRKAKIKRRDLLKNSQWSGNTSSLGDAWSGCDLLILNPMSRVKN